MNLLWVLTVSAYAFQAIFRQSSDIIKQSICSLYSLDTYIYTTCYLSAYNMGYALAQIPSGILLDRISLSKFFRMSSILFILGLILYIMHAYYFSIQIAACSRIISGIAAGTIYNTAVKIATSSSKNESEVGDKISLLMSMNITVLIFGEVFLTYISNGSSAFTISAISIIGIVLFSSIIMTASNEKQNKIQINEQNLLVEICNILTNVTFLRIIFFGAGLYISLLFSTVVGIVLLNNTYGITNVSTLLVCKYSTFVGSVIGLRLYLIAKRIIGLKNTLIISCCVQIISMMTLGAEIFHNIFVLMLLFAFVGSSLGCIPLVVSCYLPMFKENKSLPVAIQNMMVWIVMGIIPSLVTKCSEFTQNGITILSSIMIYSLFNLISFSLMSERKYLSKSTE